MTQELRTTEARQGDHRRMNMWALFWGVPGAVVLLAVLALLWSGAV